MKIDKTQYNGVTESWESPNEGDLTKENWKEFWECVKNIFDGYKSHKIEKLYNEYGLKEDKAKVVISIYEILEGREDISKWDSEYKTKIFTAMETLFDSYEDWDPASKKHELLKRLAGIILNNKEIIEFMEKEKANISSISSIFEWLNIFNEKSDSECNNSSESSNKEDLPKESWEEFYKSMKNMFSEYELSEAQNGEDAFKGVDLCNKYGLNNEEVKFIISIYEILEGREDISKWDSEYKTKIFAAMGTLFNNWDYWELTETKRELLKRLAGIILNNKEVIEFMKKEGVNISSIFSIFECLARPDKVSIAKKLLKDHIEMFELEDLSKLLYNLRTKDRKNILEENAEVQEKIENAKIIKDILELFAEEANESPWEQINQVRIEEIRLLILIWEEEKLEKFYITLVENCLIKNKRDGLPFLKLLTQALPTNAIIKIEQKATKDAKEAGIAQEERDGKIYAFQRILKYKESGEDIFIEYDPSKVVDLSEVDPSEEGQPEVLVDSSEGSPSEEGQPEALVDSSEGSPSEEGQPEALVDSSEGSPSEEGQLEILVDSSKKDSSEGVDLSEEDSSEGVDLSEEDSSEGVDLSEEDSSEGVDSSEGENFCDKCNLSNHEVEAITYISRILEGNQIPTNNDKKEILTKIESIFDSWHYQSMRPLKKEFLTRFAEITFENKNLIEFIIKEGGNVGSIFQWIPDYDKASVAKKLLKEYINILSVDDLLDLLYRIPMNEAQKMIKGNAEVEKKIKGAEKIKNILDFLASNEDKEGLSDFPIEKVKIAILIHNNNDTLKEFYRALIIAKFSNIRDNWIYTRELFKLLTRALPQNVVLKIVDEIEDEIVDNEGECEKMQQEFDYLQHIRFYRENQENIDKFMNIHDEIRDIIERLRSILRLMRNIYGTPIAHIIKQLAMTEFIISLPSILDRFPEMSDFLRMSGDKASEEALIKISNFTENGIKEITTLFYMNGLLARRCLFEKIFEESLCALKNGIENLKEEAKSLLQGIEKTHPQKEIEKMHPRQDIATTIKLTESALSEIGDIIIGNEVKRNGPKVEKYDMNGMSIYYIR